MSEQRIQHKLHWYVDDDGSLVLNGPLPAEVGALVVNALEAAVSTASEAGTDMVKHVSAETSRSLKAGIGVRDC